MGFTLRHLRTGEVKAFSTKEVLEMLGDPVNDEIIVHNEVYRISSYVGSDGGDGTVPTLKWNQVQLTYSPKTGNNFPFAVSIDGKALFFSINGVLYQYGTDKDFHTDGTKLYWHGSFNLETTDVILVKYLQII